MLNRLWNYVNDKGQDQVNIFKEYKLLKKGLWIFNVLHSSSVLSNSLEGLKLLACVYRPSGKQSGSWSAQKPADLDLHCCQNGYENRVDPDQLKSQMIWIYTVDV